MFNFIKSSLQRKKARRVTQEYPPVINRFDLEGFGEVEFANWSNPLVGQYTLNDSMISFYKQFIQEGDLIIDIGTNIGGTTVPMALCAGKNGMTVGFDPNPVVFKILEKNASLNPGKTNIIPLPCAISVKDEEFYFISSEASFANGGISPTKESKHGKFIFPEMVKGVNLKKILEEKFFERLSKFSFIKIDTEGYDKEILKSIADLITEYKPVIIAESFGKSSDEAKMELFEIIESYGYDIFYFGDFDINTKVKKLNTKTEMTEWKDTINVFATPKKN